MWYNPFYSIVQFRVTTLRYRPKEAVPIEPKQQRHISTDGVKTTAGATGQPGAPAPKNKKKPKKRRSIIGMIFSFIGCMLCLCIMAASVGGVLLSMYIVQVTADDAETLDLDNQKNRQTSIVYDINGNEYASLSRNENRIWRELSAMPENLQNAVIAIEDKNFRTEPGINLKGTIGAALNAFTGNRIWGTNRGASTLEQQLIIVLCYLCYIVPIFFPQLIWLAAAQIFQGLWQIPAHGIVLNMRLKSKYNPGLLLFCFH